MSSKKHFAEAGKEDADRAAPMPRLRSVQIDDRDTVSVVAVRVRREASHVPLFLRHALGLCRSGKSFAD